MGSDANVVKRGYQEDGNKMDCIFKYMDNTFMSVVLCASKTDR